MNAPDVRLPPHSIEAEQSLIGALLLDNSAWDRIADIVAEGDFYRDDHRRTFSHIRRLVESGRPADVVTVYESIEKSNEVDQTGGMAYLGEIANATPSAANIRRYAEIVRERAIQRQLDAVGKELRSAVASGKPLAETLAAAEARIACVREQIAAPESRFALLTAEDISAASKIAADLVKGVFPRRGIVALFGQSMGGKGFVIFDLMPVIAEGGLWFGRSVEAAPVVYLCLEGAGGIPKRIRAWEVANARPFPAGVHFIFEAFDLRRAEDVAGLGVVIRDAGLTGAVLIIDTLNQATPGADENASGDMGKMIAAAKALQAAIDGLVLLVAHVGKDAAKGLRGHSSLIAALDAAIEVRRDGDRREWLVAKSKDDVDGAAHQFRLSVVEIGTDADGGAITSCVVESVEDPAQAVQRAKVPQGGNQRIAWDALGELLRASNCYGKAGAAPSRPCVELEAAVIAIRDRLATEPKRRTERTRQAITGLVASGLLKLNEGWLWVA